MNAQPKRLLGIFLCFTGGFFSINNGNGQINSREDIKNKFSVEFSQIELFLVSQPNFTKEISPNTPRNSEEIQFSVRKSKANVEILSNKDINYTKTFLTGLNCDLQVFRDCANKLRTKAKWSDSLFEDVKLATKDLTIKSEAVSRCNTDSFSTTVNTIDPSGNDTNNCKVCYCVWRANLGPPVEKMEFDGWSSPTTNPYFPAGTWWVWTERRGKVGEKRFYECGIYDCQKTRNIDVPVP